MSLTVSLKGSPIGTLHPGTGTDYTFEYTDEVVVGAGLDAIVLSQSLPVRKESFDPAATRSYFEGLLPESARRDEVARELRVSPHDSYRLLEEIGRDCAGAVVIAPGGDTPTEENGAIEWLSDKELVQLVEDLPRRPLGIAKSGRKVRLSIAGVQRKLALARDSSGRFGQPTGDTASTHLIKPEYGDEYPDLAANEMFCMSVARDVGLSAADTEVIEIGERRCLVSRRFDRADGPGGITRLHQEDLCQALGIPANLKYETDSGPGFHHFRTLLEEIGRGADVRNLVRAAVLNFVLGNSDAHGKNFAILFAPEGRRLAPLYDVVSTGVYELEDAMAMAIGANFDPGTVRLEDWLDMSADCDIAPSRFFALVRETARQVRDTAEAIRDRATEEGWHKPVLDGVFGLARTRCELVDAALEPR